MLKRLFSQFAFALMLLGAQIAMSQSSNAQRITKIDAEIKKAVTAENYQKAANLKREKELRLEMAEALKTENYGRAAEIKKQLEAGPAASSSSGPNLASLESDLQQAINVEDYKKAAKIQKQIDALKSGKPLPASKTPTATKATNSHLNSSEPEFVNQVYYSDINGNLHSLEKAEGQLKTSGGGFYYASATSSYMITGASSPVRLERGKLNFVVKTLPGMDPAGSFKLVKLDVRGRRSSDRYADAYKSTAAMFHSETGAVSENNVPIAFRSLGNNVFQIVIEKDLGPGEYSFMYITKMFAFGID